MSKPSPASSITHLDMVRLWVIVCSPGAGDAGAASGDGEGEGLVGRAGTAGSVTGEGLVGTGDGVVDVRVGEGESGGGGEGGGAAAAATPMVCTAGSHSWPLTALMLSCTCASPFETGAHR